MAEHETIADVIAWLRKPREGENAYLTLWRDEIADRLEAAHKRERGNAAKLREALERLREWAALDLNENTYIEQKSGNYLKLIKGVLKIANAALAAPPRNCDIHTDFNDAIMTLANKRNWHDGKWNSERYCILASWLLAPATEKEGGNDEQK